MRVKRELLGWRWSRSVAGFTLIELMVVVAIVAILAAIALPSYKQSVLKGRRSQAKADIVELAQQLERQYTVNRTYANFILADSGITQSPRDGRPFVAYTIAMDVLDAKSYTISATPANGQADDPCGKLSLDQTGKKSHASGDNDSCNWGSNGARGS